MGVGLGVEVGLGLFDAPLEVRLLGIEFDPGIQHGGLVLSVSFAQAERELTTLSSSDRIAEFSFVNGIDR